MTSVRDILVVSIVLFSVAVAIFFVVNLGHRVNVNLLTVPVMNNSAEAISVVDHTDAALNMSDYLYLALFVSFFISVIIFGWFVGGTPIMAPIYFFILIIFVFVSVILQLVWSDISNNSAVAVTQLSLPITYFIMSNLGYFMSIVGLLGILVMYAKPTN